MIKQMLLLSLLLVPCSTYTMDAQRIDRMIIEGKTVYKQNDQWIGRENEGEQNYGEVVKVDGKMKFVANSDKKDEFNRLEAAYNAKKADLTAKVAASGIPVKNFAVQGGKLVQQNDAAPSATLSCLAGELAKCTVREDSTK